MYRTIVAGCNGYERGRGAVSLAHAIASATGARLVLVGVHHNPPLPFPGAYAEQRAELEHALRAVRDELAPEAVVQIHADLSPARALRHVAERERADLLVVGSRHRRRLQHILEGDHAMQVLHGAACAVAIAPDPLAPHPELQADRRRHRLDARVRACSGHGARPRRAHGRAPVAAAGRRRHDLQLGRARRRWAVPRTSTSRSSRRG